MPLLISENAGLDTPLYPDKSNAHPRRSTEYHCGMSLASTLGTIKIVQICISQLDEKNHHVCLI